MTSLPASLTTALTAIASQSGDQQVITVFTELRLYLEHNKDQLDMANAKNIQLEAELNQVNGELNAVSQSLAMALARPASSNPLGGAQTPKLSKIFADPGTYDGSRGKKFEEWWTCIRAWQDKNSAALAGAAGIHAVLPRMVGGDASTFARRHVCKYVCLSIQIAPASSQHDFTKIKALLDSDANTIFIDKIWAEKHKVPLTPLQNPIPVYNVDGTRNSAGSITHATELIVEFQGHCEKIIAEVMDLGKNSFILGFS